MRNREFDFANLMGTSKENIVSEPVLLYKDDEADSQRPLKKVVPDSSPEAAVKIDKRKGSKTKEASGKPDREKTNFFCRVEHVSYLRLLASYRKSGPGAVLDDALSRYFSDADIVSELKQAFEEEQLRRDKDRLDFESRFKSEN